MTAPDDGLRVPSFAAVASLDNGIKEAMTLGGDVAIDLDAAVALRDFIERARRAALAATESSAPAPEGLRVIGRTCTCGHPESDHEEIDCAYGWSGEPDEEACDCAGFFLDFEEVAATPSEPEPPALGQTRLYMTAEDIEAALKRLRGPVTRDEGTVMVAAQAAADALRGNVIVLATPPTPASAEEEPR